MVIPPHTIAADPTTTTNFKLFLGGWMSLRHLDKFPELNLEIALAEVWLLEESKENNFARRAWRVAIMLLYDTCLVISCPLIVVSCLLLEIHFSKNTILYIVANHIQSFFFFFERAGYRILQSDWFLTRSDRWNMSDKWNMSDCQWNIPVTLIVWQSDIFHFHFHLFHTIPRGFLLMRASFVMLLTTRSDGRARKGVRRG